jgi:type IV pilus assembly protein PilA
MEKMTTTINKMQMGRKPNNKKGFTLVEIIVVLVILAILAAILIPSMVGYISKAQKKTAIVEARSVTLAAQTLASEDYSTAGAPAASAVKSLAEVSGTVTSMTVSGKKITGFKYTTSDSKYVVTYNSAASGSAKYSIADAK